jgi:hypothetical protein
MSKTVTLNTSQPTKKENGGESWFAKLLKVCAKGKQFFLFISPTT